MDQYLKDSPNDQFDQNFDENYQFDNFENHQDNVNQVNNNFSLNMEQPFESNLQDDFDNQFPSIPGSEFLSPRNEVGSYHNEPFLDELDSNFQINQGASPQFVGSFNNEPANLDQIISPQNNNNNGGFLDSQYFSPPTKATIDLNTLSPEIAANINARSIPFQNINNFDLNSGSYLSPSSTNFGESIDTLRSPNFGSYLNSPPQYNHSRSISLNLQNSSVPNNMDNYLSPPNTSSNGNLNFPNTYQPRSQFSEFSNDSSNQLGTSAPSNSGLEDNISSKQLTKEEKLKRRREFHNAVERRRRDLIKEKIKELGVLVPPSLLNPQLVAVQTFQKSAQLNNEEISELLSTVKVKESKPNKSTILNKSVDYIIHLQYVLQQQEKAKKLLQDNINNLEQGIPNLSLGNNNDNSNPSDLSNNMVDNTDGNFMQDFQNHQNEENFDPDEFFSEIITGNDQI
ncbi:hypothetical protein CLIB1444_03S08944 [[Candida] jaroonii]|uniref:Uncharacterized protein n=1 Tax=[Candida] jaroonii TaxID=467808 RepID=A0ACA9Y5X5_9ASCO|nr:hypothetical protein CLIB1444_03S08944 [[Candida] jaroonii]